MNSKLRVFSYAILGCSFLSGCAPSAGPLTQSAVQETVAEDIKVVYQSPKPEGPLKVEDALARAIRYNLDTKVAELDELISADNVTLDMLAALPSVTGKVSRVGRNNRGGSSSLSLLTGTQSLQPSISTDQYRDTQLLNVQWNLLDAGINVGRAYSSSDRELIAQERRRKVYHDVVQDTYAAYWRVAAAQMSLPVVEDLLKQSDEQIVKIDDGIRQGIIPLGEAQQAKATLLDKRKQVLDLKESILLAEIELKTLIDYPLDEPIALDLGGQDWLSTSSLPKIKGTIDQLEQTAFENRPELREEILNKRISVRDIKLSIIEAIPGAEFVLGFNRDSNSFLANKTWVDGTISLTQSITKILTTPVRYNRAKNVDELADKRRQALVAAILTQVYVSRARYDSLSSSYQESIVTDTLKSDTLVRAENFASVGMMSAPQLLNIKIDAAISKINKAFSYANVQDAYGRFVTTMGVDLWDADSAGLPIPDFAAQLKEKLADPEIFVAQTEGGPVGEVIAQ